MANTKKLTKYTRLLRKYQTRRDVVKIYRTVTEGEANITGIIQEFSDDFMQITEDSDLKFDGEIIIRMNHFDGIRCNKFDKTLRRILKGEKQLTQSKPKRTKIDLCTWKSIFTGLRESDIHVIIECEDLKHPSFTIGPIEKVGKKSVKIRYYDATGQLDSQLTKIPFKNITLVRFQDNYSTTFRKYLK